MDQSKTDIIGRTEEKDILTTLLGQAKQFHGQIALLSGDAGIGKTTVLAYLQSVAENSGFLVVRGECTEQDRDFPYAPVIDSLRTHFSGLTTEELQEIITPFGYEIVKLLPELAYALHVDSTFAPLEPEAEKRRLFEILLQVYQRLTSDGLLLIFEDIHWCDANSLEFLYTLTRRINKLPILVIVSSRPAEGNHEITALQDYIQRANNGHSIRLNPLTRAETERLTHAVLQSSEPIHPNLLDTINTLAQGNPLYTGQILYMLLQNRQINLVNGSWIVTSETGVVQIPQSISQTIQKQLDRLDSNEKEVLRYAAVAGREFDLSILQQLGDFDDMSLLRLIKRLINLRFFEEVSRDRFAFRHTLLRQGIYASMLIRERQIIHQKLLRYFEQLDAGTNHYLADLSYHGYQSEAWESALEYGVLAGKYALSLHSPRAALEHFNHAIEAAQRLGRDDIWDLHIQRGKVFGSLGKFQSADEDYQTALQIAEATQNQEAAWQTLLALAKLWAARDYAPVKDYCERALQLAQQMGDTAKIGFSLNRLGNWYVNSGQSETALTYYQDALSIFDAIDDLAGKAETFELLGMAASNMLQLKKAEIYLHRAIELQRKLDHRQTLISSLADLGLMTINVDMILEATEIARQIGLYSAEAYTYVCAANLYSIYGEFSRGLSSVQRAIDLAQAIDHTQWLAAAHLRAGLIYLTVFDLEKAAEHAKSGALLAAQAGSQIFADRAVGLQASIYIAQHRLDEADALLNDPQTQSKTLRRQFEVIPAESELALARGQPEKVIAVGEQIERMFSAQEETIFGAAHTVFHVPYMAQALMLLDRHEQAINLLEKGKQICAANGIFSIRWRLDILMGKILAQSDEIGAESCFQQAHDAIHQLAENVPADLRQNFLRTALSMIPAGKRKRANRSITHDLTDRELDIVVEVASGKSNQKIAADLHITIKTVEAHITRILSKLDLNSRTQIALWAVDNDLTPPLDGR
ncbi:MAG: AAA family ATPase [Chloroflexi bacterium]|nr:AAA family ATPase [Chloroflexota bacterium]